MTLDLERDRRLLLDVFPHDPKFAEPAFLAWQYTGSPSGRVIEFNKDDDEGRVGHYAVLPQRWSGSAGRLQFALSLNTAVAERGRGQGLFTTLAAATYDIAREEGIDAIVGVANAQSTPGFLGKLAFTLVGPLDVSILVPRPPSRRSPPVERLDLADLTDEVLDGFRPKREGVERQWDLSELRWRLADPGKSFSLFASDEALVVTCRTTQKGCPVAVILKILTAKPDNLDVNRFVNAACRHHRAPFALHAGTNPAARLNGVTVPHRFRPSPLNLIVKNLNPDRSDAECTPTTFEFLEFDAY